MLQVRWEHYGFVPSFSGKLHPKVPRVEGDECEFEIVGQQVLLGESVEAINRIAESAGGTHVFPRQGGQACCTPISTVRLFSFCTRQGRATVDLLQSGVMGVLTGLTSTLSR